jgi:hypothetical protein
MEEAIREHIPSLFSKNDKVLSNIRMQDEELDLTGEYDNYAVMDKTLVEIKTVHDYAFIQRDKKAYLKENVGLDDRGKIIWDIKKEPYLHHEIQNHAYALMLDRQPDKELQGVTSIKYVYISLSGRMVTYETPIKPLLMDNVKGRLEVLNEAWREKVPPKCICDERHPLYAPVMQYCKYKTEVGCCLETKEEEK